MFRPVVLVVALALAVRAQVVVPADGSSVTFNNAEFGSVMYSNNLNERYTITGPEGKGVEINAMNFDLENACRFDYVRILDSNGENLGDFCGTDGPVGVISVGNVVTVVFVTDSSVQRAGWKLSVKVALCPKGEKPCPTDNTKCIGWAAYCNTVMDCPDNSDEQHCPVAGACGQAVVPPELEINGQRIVGGREATPHSWPWQFAFVSKSSKSQFCGGSILSANFVITAAHCCQRTAASSQVLVGAHNLNNVVTEGAQYIDIKRIINHPNYRAATTDFDYCILELATPIVFGRNMAPVCLPSPGDSVAAGATVYITGWGTTSSGGMQSRKLLQTDVAIVAQETCKTQYGATKITDQMICAANTGKDSCQGDSGGPMVRRGEDGKFTLFGVTSWGRGCAMPGYAGVYAAVTPQVEWIMSTIAQPSA